MIVERVFGSLALYHKDQSTVLHSGDVVLDAIGSEVRKRQDHLQVGPKYTCNNTRSCSFNK